MISQSEIEFSTYLITKAECRLAYQARVVAKLHPGSEPKFAALAEDLLGLMEDRVTVLYRNHIDLMRDMEIMASAATTV